MSSNILNIFLDNYFSLCNCWYLTDTGGKDLIYSSVFLPSPLPPVS